MIGYTRVKMLVTVVIHLQNVCHCGYTPVKMRVIGCPCFQELHFYVNCKFVTSSVYKQHQAFNMFLGLSFLLKGMIFEWLIFLLLIVSPT